MKSKILIVSARYYEDFSKILELYALSTLRAKKIKYKKKIKFFKKYIIDSDKLNIKTNKLAAIVTPDVDIIENTDDLSPAYLVFKNYELILKWNRSLRFALAVCTLKNEFKNAL